MVTLTKVAAHINQYEKRLKPQAGESRLFMTHAHITVMFARLLSAHSRSNPSPMAMTSKNCGMGNNEA
jgi:hypothetical protein